MTILMWVVVAIVAVVGIVGAIVLFVNAFDEESKGFVLAGVFVLVITASVCGTIYWYCSTSASGQRALKDQQSDLSGGISRTVTVYDVSGKEIKSYSGKFDVETGNDDNATYILFDDDNGKRHIIFYTTGTICIDEN